MYPTKESRRGASRSARASAQHVAVTGLRDRLVRRAGRSLLRALAPAAAAAFVLAGCGGDDSETATPRSEATPPRAGKGAVFPRPSNRSLRTLVSGIPVGPELAPSVSLLEPGRNRFGFALFDRGNRQIGGLKTALYVARGLDETARGPFVARYEPIAVKGRFRSRQTVEDPDAAGSVYVAKVPFRGAGGYAVAAVAQLGRKLVAASPIDVMVRDESGVPGVGDRAIRVHTPTRDSVGGDIESIETRIPPDSMHEVDLADALDDGRPVTLVFSTPALCQTRVCGPVTDVAEEVKSEFGDRAEFIHMEIYKENEVEKGLRPQVRAWHLETEPFVFTIDDRGVIAARLEGAFSADELRAAVRAALR
jgi:hypothetical protein